MSERRHENVKMIGAKCSSFPLLWNESFCCVKDVVLDIPVDFVEAPYDSFLNLAGVITPGRTVDKFAQL